MAKGVVLVSSDHNGIELKKLVKQKMVATGYQIVDFGPYAEDGSVDYNIYAANLARSISHGDAEKGVLICGTGVGVNIVANRFKGVRSVLAHNQITAQKSRDHNDANVLCLGAWVNSEQQNLALLDSWLTNEWGDLRHSKRVNMIDRNQSGIVLTNGVFDVVHRGHIELLKFAKAQGEKLVVAIDSDERVTATKGPSRPINYEDDRRSLLEALDCVDEVVIFDTTEQLQELYGTVAPDVVVKGSEWTSTELRKRDRIPDEIVVKVFPIVGDFSTTSSISKIQGKK